MIRRMTVLKGLLVDVGNVLIDERAWPPADDEPYVEVALARLAAEFGGPQPWFDELFPVDQDPDVPGWGQATLERITSRLAARSVEASPQMARDICAALAIPLNGFIEPVPEARGALEAAKALGLRMVVCSNTVVRSSADYMRDFTDFGLDSFFDAYITSLDAGFRKPHPAMFEAGLKALGTTPAETAMIGDRPDRDIAGARALGIRTIWVRHPDHVGPCEPEPDVEISNLAQLRPILERWVQE
jgi:FMN phosphatase YigB (HAD superfamily)